MSAPRAMPHRYRDDRDCWRALSRGERVCPVCRWSLAKHMPAGTLYCSSNCEAAAGELRIDDPDVFREQMHQAAMRYADPPIRLGTGFFARASEFPGEWGDLARMVHEAQRLLRATNQKGGTNGG